MSTDQPTLNEFVDASRPQNARTKPPAWTEMDTDTENQCQQCGGHVSNRFIRVMGDENGLVHACHACESSATLPRAAAGVDDR